MSFPPPQPGELQHLAKIMRLEQTGTDANGQPVGNEVVVTGAFVKRDAISGRIAEIAHQQFETATHMIIMRYHPDINRSCWVMIGNTRYDIGFVDVMRDYIRLTCQESWPEGQPQ